MNAVSEYLNAFVARRQQAKQLQDNFKEFLSSELTCSASFDFVKFEFDKNRINQSDNIDDDDDDGDAAHEYSVKLLYEDLVDTLPTRCVVKLQQQHQASLPSLIEVLGRDRAAETILKASMLPDSFDKMLAHLRRDDDNA
eukprot:m.56092 g.56092  ORF g.56092 m.56092 type:complete len:140 (-) comp22182_c0_seq1:24-443(-)